MVGWGWVLLWGDLAARVPRVRGLRAWEHMFFHDGRGGVWGLSRAVWRRGPEGDGRPQGAHLREGRSASKALLGEVYSMDEVDTAIAALERRIPGKDAVRMGLKLS